MTHKGTVYGHGDPCTPLIEGYGNERVLVRLIQGAQEVQHMFRVEGAPFRRNVDQPFPSARPLLSHANGLLRSRFDRCQENRDARDGRPRQFRDWLTGKNPGDSFWKAFADLARDCDNLMGVVAAQELGISEHFEIGGYFRSETPAIALFRARGIDLDRLGASTDDDTGPKAGLRDRTIDRSIDRAAAHAACAGFGRRRRESVGALTVGQPARAVLEHVVNPPELPHALREMRVEVAVEDRSPAAAAPAERASARTALERRRVDMSCLPNRWVPSGS